jgi:indolepyruvate decarboxylase
MPGVSRFGEPAWTTVGTHLASRLREAGVRHAFIAGNGAGAQWFVQWDEDVVAVVIACNVVNAGYAADGYARLSGMGVLFVDHGATALAAVAVAARACTDHVPLICVSVEQPPSRGGLDSRAYAVNLLRSFREVTCAQATLAPYNAISEIDRVVQSVWLSSRPAYLELPTGVITGRVPVAPSAFALRHNPSDPDRLANTRRAVAVCVNEAAAPLLMIDIDVDRYRIAGAVASLATQLNIPIVAMESAKGMIDENHPMYAGVYRGSASSEDVQHLLAASDCVLLVGGLADDYIEGSLPAHVINVSAHETVVDGQHFPGVTADDVLDAVAETTRPRSTSDGLLRRTRAAAATIPGAEGGGLSMAAYWREVQRFLRAGDVIVVDGDVARFTSDGEPNLPSDCTLIGHSHSRAVGYGIGSLLGSMLAEPRRRNMLFAGSAAFRASLPDLSTILERGFSPLIFLLHETGDTRDPSIDVGSSGPGTWSYRELFDAFARDGAVMWRRTDSASTLAEALAEATLWYGPVLIEAEFQAR